MPTRTIRFWLPAALAVLAGFGAPAPSAASEPAGQGIAAWATPTLGQKMAEYLRGRLGTRVGGGECAHVATEALRVAGGDFTYKSAFVRPKEAGGEDYVWTPNRVARLTSGPQVAGKRFRPGDILQFQDATFSSGTEAPHHTQVVATVDTAGRITQVYEENAGSGADKRRLQLNPAIDFGTLTGGSVSVYRAVPRRTKSGLVEWTVVNNTGAGRVYTVRTKGRDQKAIIDGGDTFGGFQIGSSKFTGAVGPVIEFGPTALTIQDGGAYELFADADGRVGLRQN